MAEDYIIERRESRKILNYKQLVAISVDYWPHRTDVRKALYKKGRFCRGNKGDYKLR